MKRKYSSGDADTVLESEVVSSGCRKVIVDHVDSLCDEDSTVRAEIGLPNLFTESVSVDTASVPLLSKADIISSARQRFLDRKIASSAN